MSTRIGPEPVRTVNTGISDYRPRSAPKLPAPVKSRADHADVAAEFDTASASAPAAPPLPDPATPGTAFVAAVLSGALAPRPASAQEVFMRNGTSWTPPASDYQLADKKI